MPNLGFYTSTDSIYSPVSSVVIVQMYFPKSNTRMPLSGPIEKAVVYGNANTSVTSVRRVCSNEHCLVMLSEMTSK